MAESELAALPAAPSEQAGAISSLPMEAPSATSVSFGRTVGSQTEESPRVEVQMSEQDENVEQGGPESPGKAKVRRLGGRAGAAARIIAAWGCICEREVLISRLLVAASSGPATTTATTAAGTAQAALSRAEDSLKRLKDWSESGDPLEAWAELSALWLTCSCWLAGSSEDIIGSDGNNEAQDLTAQVRTGLLLVGILSMLREVVKASIDVILPSEAVSALLDAGAPLDLLEVDEDWPVGARSALAALMTVRAEREMAPIEMQSGLPDSPVDMEGPKAMPIPRPGELVDGITRQLQEATHPLLTILVKALETLSLTIGRWILQMTVGAPDASRQVRQGTASTASALCEALLDAATDRRVEVMHETFFRLFKEVAGPLVSSRRVVDIPLPQFLQQAAPAAAPAAASSAAPVAEFDASNALDDRWFARRLHCIRRLHFTGRLLRSLSAPSAAVRWLCLTLSGDLDRNAAPALGADKEQLVMVMLAICQAYADRLRDTVGSNAPLTSLDCFHNGQEAALLMALRILVQAAGGRGVEASSTKATPATAVTGDPSPSMTAGVSLQLISGGRWAWHGSAGLVAGLSDEEPAWLEDAGPCNLSSASPAEPAAADAQDAVDSSSAAMAETCSGEPLLGSLSAEELLEEAHRLTESSAAEVSLATGQRGIEGKSSAADGALVLPLVASTAPPPPPGQPPSLSDEATDRRRMSGSLLFKALVGSRQSASTSTTTAAASKPLPGTTPQSAMCTYVKTGSHFVEQHWYYCYTCSFSNEKGVCAVCAQTCHAGHQVVYSRRSRFFCDCGASGCCTAVQRAMPHRVMKHYPSWALAQPQQGREQQQENAPQISNEASRGSQQRSRISIKPLSRTELQSVVPISQALTVWSPQGPPRSLGPPVQPLSAIKPQPKRVDLAQWADQAATALLQLLKPLATLLRREQDEKLLNDAMRPQELSEVKLVLEIVPWACFPKGSFECQLRGEWAVGGSRQQSRSVIEVRGAARRPVAFLSRNQLVVTEKDRVRLVELKDDISARGGESQGDETPAKRRRVFEEVPEARAKAVPLGPAASPASSGRLGEEARSPGGQVLKAVEVIKRESCRFATPFEPLGVAASSSLPGVFAICSFEDCHVCVPGRAEGMGSSGGADAGAITAYSEAHSLSGLRPLGVVHRMALELMLEAHGEAIVVLKVCWLPASKTELAIVTNQFVKIYDLAVDRICPSHYVQVVQGAIADATFEIRRSSAPASADRSSMMKMSSTSYRLWVLGVSPPALYHRDLGGQTGDGPGVLQRSVAFALPASSSSRSGLCVLFSQRQNLLMASFDDGLLVMGNPVEDGESLQGFRVLQTPVREAPSKERVVSYSQLLEWEHVPGIFVGWSRKHNAVHIIQVTKPGKENCGFAVMPIGLPSGSPRGTFEGIALWSDSSEAANLAVLMEDGSLYLYSLRRASSSSRAADSSGGLPGGLLALEHLASTAEQHFPTSTPLETPLQAQSTQPAPLEFPRDFFEHAVNLMAEPVAAKDITIAGDAAQHLSTEVVRQRLSTQNEEVLSCEAPENSEGFTLELRFTTKRRWVPVGVRLLLAHSQRTASPRPGPTSMLFVEGQRRVSFWSTDTLPTGPGSRRWFDVAFSPKESQACLMRSPVGVTLTFAASGAFVIDALEIYAVPFASFPRQFEGVHVRSQSQVADFAGTLLACSARGLIQAWLGGAAAPPLPASPAAPARIAASSARSIPQRPAEAATWPATIGATHRAGRAVAAGALSCLSALREAAGADAVAPPEVCSVAALWQDLPVAEEAALAMEAWLPAGSEARASTELLLVADSFLERASTPELGGQLSVLLAAVAAEWCQKIASGTSSCRQLLQRRPAFAEALGLSVRSALGQPLTLHLCPRALVGSLVTAAVTASLLQLQLHLEDCFHSSGATPDAGFEDSETIWRTLCESEDNAPLFENIAYLVAMPSAIIRDFALRALLGFLDSIRTNSASASNGEPGQRGLSVESSATRSEDPQRPSGQTSDSLMEVDLEEPVSSDGSDVEEDDEEIPTAGATAQASAPSGDPKAQADVEAGHKRPHTTEEAQKAAPGTGAELLPLLILTYFSSLMSCDNLRWAQVRCSSLAVAGCLFEASQRLVLTCLEGLYVGTPGGRYALLLRSILRERAEVLALSVLRCVQHKCPTNHDSSAASGMAQAAQCLAKDLLEQSERTTSDGDVRMPDQHEEESRVRDQPPSESSKDFLGACMNLLGALLTTLLRLGESAASNESSGSAAAAISREVLAEFRYLAAALMMPLFAVVQRSTAALVRDTGNADGFLATGGTPPPPSTDGLLRVPQDVPAIHLHGLLPTVWQEACEAEGCHALERPAELLTMSALTLLTTLLWLARCPEYLSSSSDAQGDEATGGATSVDMMVSFTTALRYEAETTQDEVTIGRCSSAEAAAARSAARTCGEVLTQLAIACDGVHLRERPSPVSAALAAEARCLLLELCCRARVPYFRLLDSALYASVKDDLQAHMTQEAIGNRQINAFVEACQTLWTAAKQRPWAWAQFAASSSQILEYCFIMGHALGARYGCTPLCLPEVAESVSIPYRLISLALGAPRLEQKSPILKLERSSLSEVFRLTIEKALCSGSEELRQSASLALAVVWDDLRHSRRWDSQQSATSAAVRVAAGHDEAARLASRSGVATAEEEAVQAVLCRAVEALLMPLGARAGELSSLASYVLAIGTDRPSDNSEVVGSLIRLLCQLHLHSTVSLQQGSKPAATANAEEVALRVASLRRALSAAAREPCSGGNGGASIAAAAAAAVATAATLGAGRAASSAPQPASAFPAPSQPETPSRPKVSAASNMAGAALAAAAGVASATSTASATPADANAAVANASKICGICTELSPPLARVRLESLKADLKFSDEKLWVRFGEAMVVSSVSLVMHEHPRQGVFGRHIGHVKVYFNDVHVQDVATLKAQSHAQGWQPLCELHFEPMREGFLSVARSPSTEVSAKLSAPVTCCNLLFEYFETSAGLYGCPALESGRMLVCPLCHRPAGRAGICMQCGDNAFQCPKCRNINYEKLDALFCNDCGYCRFVKMETWLICRHTHERHVGALRGDAQGRQASETLETLVRQLHGAPTNPKASRSTARTSSGGSSSSAGHAATGTAASGGSSAGSPSGEPTWRLSSREGDRAVLTPSKRSSASEETPTRLLCSVVDIRQKLLQLRRSPPQAVRRRVEVRPPPSRPAPARACRHRGLPGVQCETCFLVVLLCILHLLARMLAPETIGEHSGRTLAALGAAVPPSVRLLEDLLLPLALRAAVVEVRVAARRVLLALAALSPRADRALCSELARCLQESCLRATPLALRIPQEQTCEETLMLLELVMSARKPRQWMSRLPLLTFTLCAATASQHMLVASQVAVPCLLFALKVAQRLHQVSSTSAASELSKVMCSWSVHVRALLLPSFAGLNFLRSKQVDDRKFVIAAQMLARWQARLPGGSVEVGSSNFMSFNNWAMQALTHESSARVRHLAREMFSALLAANQAELSGQGAADSAAETVTSTADEASSSVPKISSGGAALRVLDRLREAVLEAPSQPRSEAALQLAHSLLVEPQHWARRVHCAATNWLPLLRNQIREECSALVPSDGGVDSGLWSNVSVFPAWLEVHHASASQAESLTWALKLLHLFLMEPLLAHRRRREGLELAECVLSSLLIVRSVQQSHFLQSAHLLEASALLEKALQQLQGDAPPTEAPLGTIVKATDFSVERKFLAACIRTLRSEGLTWKMHLLGLPLSVATKFTYEQIAELLCPERQERSVLLHLQKVSTQEEYIRGQMRKNPYVSTEIGTNMSHVREKICSDLNIRDAMEIMELLVADRIIGLDLPVAQVYEQIWVPFVIARRERLAEQAAAERGAAADRPETAGEQTQQVQQQMWDIPPMTVIFRLAGVDGEATEDRVEELPDLATEAEATQAERRRSLCLAFSEIGGVGAVVEQLEALVAERGQEGSLEVLDVLLWIAFACSEVEAARRQLVDLGGMRAMLAHLLRTIDEMCARKAVETLSPLETRVAERLLSMVESLAREGGAFVQQCLRAPRASESGGYTAKDHISLLLSLLCQAEPGGAASVQTQAPTRTTPRSGEREGAPREGARAPLQWVQKMRMQVASLLPFLTFGQPAPAEVLVRASTPLPLPTLPGLSANSTPSTTAPSGASEAYGEQPREALSLDLVTAMVEHVPSDPAIGGAVRAAFLAAGTVQDLLLYLEQIFPATPCEKTSQAWVAACQAPGLPAALRILAGLARNFDATQRLVAAHSGGRLLQLLLRLEGTAVSSMQSGDASAEAGAGAQVGTCAEGLLEALKHGNEAVAQKINALRREQRKGKASRANQSRQKMLRALGMAPAAPAAASSEPEVGAVSSTAPVAPMAVDIAEEVPKPQRNLEAHAGPSGVEELMNFEDVAEDLRCCVCQEGYHFQPEEVLCVYTFVKPIAIHATSITLEAESEEGSPQMYRVAPRFGLCSVSHFTVIHWHCHQSATKAAANLRPKPQGEWESATVRNSSSKCNALIPVLGTSLPDAATAQALERNFGHLAHVAKGNAQAVSSRRAACTLHDLRLCFTRLACQESFSTDTGGGGPRHNMCLAIIMLQLLCHDTLASELTEELGELERNCIDPLMSFRSYEEVASVIARFRITGQPSGPHPGHLWALCAFTTLFRAGTPGGGSTLEWSAGTLWKLLALALEISRQHGPMRWDQRRTSPLLSAASSPRSSPRRTPQASPRPSPVPTPAQGSPRGERSPLGVDMPNFTLEPAATGVDDTGLEEEDPESALRDAELSLMADAVPMLRFLALCDVWRWRLERWSREGSSSPAGDDVPGPGKENTPGTASDSVSSASSLSDEHLGTPLLSRCTLRRRLRRFDGQLIEMGEAVAHLFSGLSSPAALWSFFLYRLGDASTPFFDPRLAPHGSGTDPLELLRPPRMKADPSLPEASLLPRLLLKSALSRESVVAGAPRERCV